MWSSAWSAVLIADFDPAVPDCYAKAMRPDPETVAYPLTVVDPRPAGRAGRLRTPPRYFSSGRTDNRAMANLEYLPMACSRLMGARAPTCHQLGTNLAWRGYTVGPV